MKRFLPALAAVGALAVALPAAAQSWAPIDARQATLEARIEQGLRNGSLTRREAVNLRGEFHDIASLEARYRTTGGLQGWERADLDRRFDQLSARIQIARADTDRGGAWQSINLRQTMLDRRIDRGLRDGTLTRGEATRLQREFRDVVRLEARYRNTGGLQGWERADLDRRFDRLSAQIRVERADSQTQYDRDRDRDRDHDRGYGRGGVGINAGAR
jgi:hypothetical protein